MENLFNNIYRLVSLIGGGGVIFFRSVVLINTLYARKRTFAVDSADSRSFDHFRRKELDQALNAGRVLALEAMVVTMSFDSLVQALSTILVKGGA